MAAMATGELLTGTWRVALVGWEYGVDGSKIEDELEEGG